MKHLTLVTRLHITEPQILNVLEGSEFHYFFFIHPAVECSDLRNNWRLDCSWYDMNVNAGGFNIIRVCPEVLVTKVNHSFDGQNLAALNKKKIMSFVAVLTNSVSFSFAWCGHG